MHVNRERIPTQNGCLSVERSHGLGNVFLLLPVLDGLIEQGVQVHLVTQTQWVNTLRTLRPKLLVSDQCRADTVDLDLATLSLKPAQHRTCEFAQILNFTGPIKPLSLSIPADWSRPFLKWKGGIGFAPEGGHPSRQWPDAHSADLARALLGSPLILIGIAQQPALHCDFDTRGTLNLEELLGLLTNCRLVICMDSGMLHLSAGLGIPTVGLFGGIQPEFRIWRTQQVLALQAELACCPCNKQEICDGRYDCIKAITPQHVLMAMEHCLTTPMRMIRRV